ncbi:MAG: NUDIX domain-containing protein [Candidatus Paceibacterota bacterium]|jgi:8-oxo-dGTP diphosphatase
MIEEIKKPKVGVGVMIFKDGKVLFKKRKSFLGMSEYSFTGGHLDYMESFEECARRETREEAGIEIKNIRLNYLANIKKYKPKHYIDIGVIADWESGEPQVLEPEKNDSWEWYEIDSFPEPLFYPCQLALKSYKTGKINYYDNL